MVLEKTRDKNQLVRGRALVLIPHGVSCPGKIKVATGKWSSTILVVRSRIWWTTIGCRRGLGCPRSMEAVKNLWLALKRWQVERQLERLSNQGHIWRMSGKHVGSQRVVSVEKGIGAGLWGVVNTNHSHRNTFQEVEVALQKQSPYKGK
ncbi:hypothetical protein QYF36_016273 [Acer negundo]|nr:hypothetical protein QYF36_016273 [Acer negundo]